MELSSPTHRIRIVLLDSHALIRSALRLVLEHQPRFDVVAEAILEADAVKVVAGHRPDIILINLLLQAQAVELIPRLLTAVAPARLIAVTAPQDDDVRRQTVHLGAMGVVRADQPPTVLVNAITKVHAGEIWANRQLLTRVLTEQVQSAYLRERDPERAKIAMLTERERELIGLMTTGLRMPQIRQRLSVAEPTVRRHLTSIYSKLGVANRAELIVYAYRHGLVTWPS